MNFDLWSAPTDVPNEQLWLTGLQEEIIPGDLWLLSWNGNGLALLLVTTVTDDFVLGWPVTLPSEPAYAPAMPIETPLGINAVAWPTRETGVGLHLLHRRFGKVLSRERIDNIRRQIDEGLSFGMISSEESTLSEPDAQRDHSNEMLSKWEEICFHHWPQAEIGETPLNQSFLQNRQIAPSDLGRILNIDAVQASSLHKGRMKPTADQLTVLSSYLDTDREVIAAPTLDEGTRLLMEPRWKAEVLDVAAKTGLSEVSTRRAIQNEYVLAARSNQASGDDKMVAAIQRVLEQESQ